MVILQNHPTTGFFWLRSRYYKTQPVVRYMLLAIFVTDTHTHTIAKHDRSRSEFLTTAAQQAFLEKRTDSACFVRLLLSFIHSWMIVDDSFMDDNI